jgi:hypothetical protein
LSFAGHARCIRLDECDCKTYIHIDEYVGGDSGLLSKYDVNAAAASVKVYAIKPKIKFADSTAAPCCAPGCCS